MSNMCPASTLPMPDATKTFLTCPLCQEFYDDPPKALYCLHTFCSSCVERLQNRQLIACPICMIRTPLPPSGIKGLPSDFRIQQMKDALQKQENPPATLRCYCDVCKGTSQKKAKFHCAKCSIFFCDDCVKKHNGNSVFRDHRINDISEDETRNNLLCAKHPNRAVGFYCHTCKPHNTLCSICILDHDSGHDISQIDAFAEMAWQDLKQGIDSVSNQKEGFREYLKTVRKEVDLNNEMLKEVQESISRRASEMIDKIRKEEMKMLKEAQDEFENITSGYNISDVSSAVSNMKSLILDLEAVTSDSKLACVDSYETLSERVKQVEKATDLLHSSKPDVLQFIPIQYSRKIKLGTFKRGKAGEISKTKPKLPETYSRSEALRRQFEGVNECIETQV